MLKALIKNFLRYVLKPLFVLFDNVGYQRRFFSISTAALLSARGVRRGSSNLGGIASECLIPREPADLTLLYLHGGGYCVGSPSTCRSMTSRIARASGATTYVPDYRLAPEHPHPAALDDALASYRALLAQGVAPKNVVIGGDSAGGGLSVATAVALRDQGLPLPAALVLISPWTDLECQGRTYASVGSRDPMLDIGWTRACAAKYLNGRPACDPACSPLYADLKNLPPILIQVGSEEIVLDESRRLHERAKAAGVNVELHEYHGLWHDFQMYAGLLREADQAIEEIAAFMREHAA